MHRKFRFILILTIIIPFVIVSSILVCYNHARINSSFTYSGTVVNQADGKPVEGVLVLVGYSEFYTRTDKNGNFTISTTPVKSAERLIFRHDNYYPKDIDITSSSTKYRIELKPDERSLVFDQSKVHEYRFTITPADSAYLDTAGFLEKYVQANMTYEGKAYGTIGIRYKG